MSNYGTLLLSRVIDANDVAALARHGISEQHFGTDAEKSAYKFIRKYAEQNRGQAPSYAAVVEEVSGFYYIPQVSESYEYLTRKLMNDSAEREFIGFMTPEGDKKTSEMEALFERYRDDMPTLIHELTTRLDTIKLRTDVRNKVGKTLTEIKESFREEYLRREEGKSFKQWKTPFPSLTKEISGWFSGDVYGIMAESGRGKTYLVCAIIDSLLRQGANVLVKSFEVKEYVFISRLISIATAVDEEFMDELGNKLGLPNRAILTGNLEEIVRERFLEIVEQLDSYYKGNLFFQGKSDSGLTRTLDDLDRELNTGSIDAVFLDPIYGLTDVYGNNANKTAGGAAEQAATRFEQIIGDHDVMGFYTVQATVEKKRQDEGGTRELNLPTRDQVKTSKRLLDIATNLISFDSVEKEGIAIIGIEKGRNGGEDFTLPLMALFDYGIVREFEVGESAVSDFDF